MKEKKQQQEDDNQFNINLLYAPEFTGLNTKCGMDKM